MSADGIFPDGVAPVVGWRCWKLGRDDDHPRLESPVYREDAWEPGVAVTAVCSGSAPITLTRHRGEHLSVAPDRNCNCGIYAVRDPDGHQLLRGNDLRHFVLGEVFLWGKIIEGDNGFRGQHAYPKHLFIADAAAIQERRMLNAPIECLCGRDEKKYIELVAKRELLRERLEESYNCPVTLGGTFAAFATQSEARLAEGSEAFELLLGRAVIAGAKTIELEIGIGTRAFFDGAKSKVPTISGLIHSSIYWLSTSYGLRAEVRPEIEVPLTVAGYPVSVPVRVAKVKVRGPHRQATLEIDVPQLTVPPGGPVMRKRHHRLALWNRN